MRINLNLLKTTSSNYIERKTKRKYKSNVNNNRLKSTIVFHYSFKKKHSIINVKYYNLCIV